MALTETLGTFLEDFGLSVTSGAVTALGILDSPTEEVLGGMVISTDYALKVRTSELGAVQDGATVTVAGVDYTARRDATPIDDGVFSVIHLSKT